MMSACVALMFVAVLLTAALIEPDWHAIFQGLLVPRVPDGGAGWTLGVLGGVGGTVTLLAYGYWIREVGRSGEAGVRLCRIDLAVGYAMTALFGAAMIIIGSRIKVHGSGALVAVALAEQLEGALGIGGRIVFLAGFWGAVFSSLLGVWQSAPYLFADFLALRNRSSTPASGSVNLTQTRAYRAYLVAIALVPLFLLWQPVAQIQLAYAVLGAMFMPFLALTLLIMNNQKQWVGERFSNGWLSNLFLAITLGLFALIGALEIIGKLPVRGG
jgi:Mn2+/Fe2+ NRAMP family transporter